MLRLGVALCFVSLAVCQLGGGGGWNWFGDRFQSWGSSNSDVIDVMHEYRFEEHTTDSAHLLFAIHDHRRGDESDPVESTCFVFVIDRSWESAFEDTDTQYAIVEEVYTLIHSPEAKANEVSAEALYSMFGDNRGYYECRRHDTYIVDYTPSVPLPSTQAPPVTTTTPGRPLGK